MPPDAGINERVVALSANPGVPIPNVGGIEQEILAIGADVEHHRNDTAWVNAAGCDVNSQLANGDLNPAYAPVANTWNLFSIGGEDQIDVISAQVRESLFDSLAMVDGKVDAARTAAFMPVLDHRHAHSPIVDDRDHFAKMFDSSL